jgi:A/G-specific adenine glycosylase
MDVKALLDWFEREGLSYPWGDPRREDKIDPYRVWISEVMLQQTVVSGVGPYFNRWMARFPGIAELAAAEEAEVLRLWEGLGYYSRARHLLAAAQKIRDEYAGGFPDRADELKKLPGVGEYTARAILSLAFHQNLAVVDANVKRVARRLAGWTEFSPAREKLLQEELDRSLPPGRAGCFNAALMQLGQKVCKLRSPVCTAREGELAGLTVTPPCPLQGDCRAFKEGLVSIIPGTSRRDITERASRLAVLLCGGMEARRDEAAVFLYPKVRGLGQGLYHFPRQLLNAADQCPANQEAAETKSRAGFSLPGFNGGPALQVRVHSYTRYRETLFPRLFYYAGGAGRAGGGSGGADRGDGGSGGGADRPLITGLDFYDAGDLVRGGWFSFSEAETLGLFSVYRQILNEAKTFFAL